MFQKLILLIILLLPAISAQLGAAAPNGKVITLQEAIEIALQNNALLKAARHAHTASRRQLKKARLDLFPKADVQLGYSRLDPGTVRRGNVFVEVGRTLVEQFGTGDPNDVRPGAYSNNFSTVLHVTQPIYNGGANWASVSLAKSREAGREYGYENTKQNIIFDIKNRYLRVLQAQELLILAKKSVQASAGHLRTAQNMLDVGLRSRTDVLRWDVQNADNEGLVVEAENNLKIAFAAIKQLLGLDPNEEFGLVPLNFDPDSVQATLDEQIRSTKNRHPGLRVSEASVNAQRAGVRIAKAAFQPKVNFVYQLGWEQNNTLKPDSFSFWAAAVSVTIPLFHSFSNWSNLQAAKAELSRLQAMKVETERALTFEVIRARLNVDSALKRYQIAQKAVEHAEENLRVLNNTYEVGLAANIDVLDAEVVHRKAQTNLINSRYDYWIARAQLDLATGIIAQ
ncbi:MAG: TolC family protein [bacterium]